jgi:hypothetical protein
VRGIVRTRPEAGYLASLSSVRNQDAGVSRETTTQTDGNYLVAGLAPGIYQITASLQGFNRFNRREIVLVIGRTTTIDVQLRPGRE